MWLGTTAGIGSDGATLAELFERRHRRGPIAETEVDVRPGQYL